MGEWWQWKGQSDRKPFIICGARQVGNLEKHKIEFPDAYCTIYNFVIESKKGANTWQKRPTKKEKRLYWTKYALCGCSTTPL
jgi:hypothetical protein